MDAAIRKAVNELMDLLVARRYGDAEILTKGIRLCAQDMDNAITTYGRTLTDLPERAWQLAIVTERKGTTSITAASVVVPFWTLEEGRSDLSLECTVVLQDGVVAIELDDIHVL